MKLNHWRPAALSVVALLVSAPAALALDANDFASKVIAAYTFSLPPSDKVTFGAATVNGNNITFDGASLNGPGMTAPMQLSVKFQFSGVTEGADGSYTADEMTVPDVNYPFEGGSVAVKNIAFKHIYVAAAKPSNILDSSRAFGEASAGPIVVTMDGTPALTIDSATLSQGFKPSQSDPGLAEIDSNGSTSGLKFDMTKAKDQDAVAQAKALGLATVTGKALESLTWSLKDGHLNISEMSLAFDNVGKLKFGFDMTGYTPEFLQNLTTASQALVGGDGAAAQANQAQASALLLQASQTLFFNSASIRYDDASITGKLLDMFAKQQGITKAALIDALVMQMAMADATSTDPTPPAVMKMMQAATRAFLTDPHSIEVRVAPKAPLGVLGIIAAAMAPQNIVEQVGLQVLVNDKPITTADADKETGAVVPPSTDDTTTAPSDDTTTAPSDDSDQTTNDDSSSDDNSTSSDDSSTDDNAATPDDNSGNSSSDNSKTDGRLKTKHN